MTWITIRVSPEDRDSITVTARSLNPSVATYLLAIHALVAEKLS